MDSEYAKTINHKIPILSGFSNALNMKRSVYETLSKDMYLQWVAVKYQVIIVHVYEYEHTWSYYVGRLIR